MEKRVLNLFVSLCLMTSSGIAVSAKDSNDHHEESEEMIQAFIYTFEGEEKNVTFDKYLQDIHGGYSYELYAVGEDGYAVITAENQTIAEVTYGTYPEDNATVYVGYQTFIEESELSDLEVSVSYSDIEDMTLRLLDEESDVVVIEPTDATRSARPNPTTPSIVAGGTVVGINNSLMDTFNGDVWVNNDGKCGAYAAAVMLTYNQMYKPGNYFSVSGAYSDGNVIGRLKNYIPGSASAAQVQLAVNTIMSTDYPSSGKSCYYTTSESTCTSKIAAGYPVCLNLQSSRGSGYGNHWVCAYQYINYNNALWYHVHDNWQGNYHRGWVNRNWVWNYVYTN